MNWEKVKDRVLIYRITHIDNIEGIIRHGLTRWSSPVHTEYRPIENADIIQARNEKIIPVGPKGHMGEYIPFYLGPRPPMLYNINRGYGVERVPGADIAYIVVSLIAIREHGIPFVFTDGNARDCVTKFFSAEEWNGLAELDWDLLYSQWWRDTDEDSDRKRRKQAECRIKQDLSVNLITGFCVYDQTAKTRVEAAIAACGGPEISVAIKRDWYYD